MAVSEDWYRVFEESLCLVAFRNGFADAHSDVQEGGLDCWWELGLGRGGWRGCLVGGVGEVGGGVDGEVGGYVCLIEAFGWA